ncbi:MAG TPA: altronate dehydratase family protein [Candidatus Avimonas sp.]|nr:altronate dehydratase [Clostridiales bacterium]HPU58236.1 altronate dehydratase family protein [Candidatus Avimonas sp.]
MKAIKIHENDNVAVALTDIAAGDIVTVDGRDIALKSDIPSGHKFAVTDIAANQKVIKYGYPIGHAAEFIETGSHVHSHNLKSDISGTLEYSYSPEIKELERLPSREFMGYKREDGSVGIRNEVWIIPTVGCVNSIVKEIERQSQSFKSEKIDGIFAYNHPYGCSQLGDDMQNTLKYLAGLINHPNAAGVLVVGLGCENGNIEELKKVLGETDEKRVKFLVAQESEDEIAEGVEIVKNLCEYANTFERTPCDASSLIVGLKCGGSDGFSGITANALVGKFSDMLVSLGGSTILTEVPEMFGAETILMNRCRDEGIFDKTVSLINGFKEYFLKHGEKTDENPSPGNKAGGITTLAEKSLGCVQKGGSAPVEDVLLYGEKVRKKGLSLLRAPGNDLVASNALVASGAQLILFTTGRGTPFGCPVPTIKISSNSKLAEKKGSWIDFNAGKLLENTAMNELAEEFFSFVLEIASGRKTKSELLDKTELAIFKDGVTL